MTDKEAIEIIQNNTNVGYGIVIEGSTEKINQALDRAIKALEERPTGEWLYGNLDYSKCSNCNYANHYGDSPFCPNCGADMRKEAYTE